MKRTKENWIVGHPDDRNGISGLRFFDGEDLHYQERKREFQNTQKQWIEEQKREKELQQEREAEEERMYAYETMQANRMRGMLEDELNRKMRMMQESTRDANIELSEQKKDKERLERQLKIRDDDEDLADHHRIRQVPQYMNPLQ